MHDKKNYLKKVYTFAQEQFDYMVKLRRDFHAHPELGLQEYRTASVIEHELDDMHISHKRIGSTGILGIIHGTSAAKGKTILLRADIDALPLQEQNDILFRSQNDGIMHACGHDVHTASLLGAAKILSSMKKNFSGEIRLVFQPAEEIGRGAKEFLAAGVLEHVNRTFGLHSAPDLKVGIIGVKPGLNNASVDQFKINIKGKSSHVCAPHLGIDALYIASQIVVSLQGIVTRLSSPVEPIIIGVGKLNAGTAYNALAEHAALEGTTRTVSPQARSFVKEQVTKTAESISSLYGGTAQIEWNDFTPPLLNDAEVTHEVKELADELFGTGHTTDSREVSLSGDNFAEFNQTVPGAYAYIGTSNPQKEETQNPLHSVRFNVDEDCLLYGSSLYAAYALSQLA